MSIFDSLDVRIMDNLDKSTVLDNVDNIIQIPELSGISNIQYTDSHFLLLKLKNIRPYRSGGILKWRGEPTSEQRQLLINHRDELVQALTPTGLKKTNKL